MRGYFSGMLRGVSNPREGSKILSVLFRPRLVCSSFLHLRSSWKGNSAKFAVTEFSGVRSEGRSTPVSQTLLAEGWLWGPRADAQSSSYHLLQV